MFDWDNLRYLLAVAREGSTLAAAKLLRVNQSTVYRRLMALEKALGGSLIERHPTGYRLTEMGRQLEHYAERIETEAIAVQRCVASFENGMIGRIRLTCSTSVGQRLLKSGLLDSFNKRYPGLNVQLVMTERLVSLSNGDTDIAIRGGEPKDPALIGKKIADVSWGIYATYAYVRLNGSPENPEDIDFHKTVGFVGEMADHRAAHWLRSKAPRAQIRAECHNIPSAFFAVKSGACLGPLPAPLAGADDELLCLLGPIPELCYPMYLLTHRELHRVPRVRAFFDFCSKKLRAVLTQPIQISCMRSDGR